jgi:hypothetical protein
MVRFGAKKVEAIPPFLFSILLKALAIKLVFLIFVNYWDSTYTSTHLQEFRLKAYARNNPPPYFWRTIA